MKNDAFFVIMSRKFYDLKLLLYLCLLGCIIIVKLYDS